MPLPAANAPLSVATRFKIGGVLSKVNRMRLEARFPTLSEINAVTSYSPFSASASKASPSVNMALFPKVIAPFRFLPPTGLISTSVSRPVRLTPVPSGSSAVKLIVSIVVFTNLPSVSGIESFSVILVIRGSSESIVIFPVFLGSASFPPLSFTRILNVYCPSKKALPVLSSPSQ